MTPQDPPELLDMLVSVPQLMLSVKATWDADQHARAHATDGFQSEGLGTLRLICKRASTVMLQAACGLRLVLTTEPGQFKPMLRMAKQLRCSQLRRLHVHIVYPWGKFNAAYISAHVNDVLQRPHQCSRCLMSKSHA